MALPWSIQMCPLDDPIPRVLCACSTLSLRIFHVSSVGDSSRAMLRNIDSDEIQVIAQETTTNHPIKLAHIK